MISTDNESIKKALEESVKKEISILEGKIANPPSEIRSDFETIKLEMMETMTDIQRNNDCISIEVSSIKDVTSKTFNLVTDIRYKVYNYFVKLCTGKSLSEAFILISSNPEYDKRLFIDLPVQYMKTTSSEHVVYINCSECQNKNKKQFVYTTCSELVVFMYVLNW